MTHVPNYASPNRGLEVRLHPMGRKQEFQALAKAAGDTPTDLINDFVAWYMGQTDELPTRPVIEDQRPAHAATASG